MKEYYSEGVLDYWNVALFHALEISIKYLAKTIPFQDG